MFIMEVYEVLLAHWQGIAIQLFLSFTIYLLIQYRFKQRGAEELVLDKRAVQRLIKEYTPMQLPSDTPVEEPAARARYNLASHDVFNLGGKFKGEIKQAIEVYGVGTCGPRGFYGTLDIHEEAERALARRFNKQCAALYSNYFSCLQTVVQCFCQPKNTVYFYEGAAEPIIRGLYGVKAGSVAFRSLDDLEIKLQSKAPNKYVIIERLSKNTGEVFDIERVTKMRTKYGFRLIVVEGYAFPLLWDGPGESEGQDIDVIVGSLSHGFPGCGGFSCGDMDVVDFQRLSSASYVFSASIPGFLTQAALCFINEKLDRAALGRVVGMAHERIPGIVSDKASPVLLVDVEPMAASEARQRLRDRGIVCGVNGKYLRLCMNVGMTEAAVEEVAKAVRGILPSKLTPK